jgi:hypothetical protein
LNSGFFKEDKGTTKNLSKGVCYSDNSHSNFLAVQESEDFFVFTDEIVDLVLLLITSEDKKKREEGYAKLHYILSQNGKNKDEILKGLCNSLIVPEIISTLDNFILNFGENTHKTSFSLDKTKKQKLNSTFFISASIPILSYIKQYFIKEVLQCVRLLLCNHDSLITLIGFFIL